MMSRLSLGLLFLLMCASLPNSIAQVKTETSTSTKEEKIIPIQPVDEARVKIIARMLPEKPRGIGHPYYDRTSWNALLKSGKFDKLIADADIANAEPLPPMTDEIYLSFFTSNDSETSKRLTVKRRLLFSTMVWAECLLNNGKYISAIESAIKDFLSLKSWNFPAEDRKKLNFEGRQYTINLSAADYAIELANAAYLLADKLKPATHQQIKDALYLRVFNPTLQAIKNNNSSDEFTSLTSIGNHNAATLSGVTGAALAAINSRDERAVFVAIAERYSKNSINGFLDDGYCTEGLGYFNYGMRHFSVLRENILKATSGKIDLFADPKLKKIALFAPGMEIINGVYPAIGDCDPDIRPDNYLMSYLSRSLKLNITGYEKYASDGPANAPLINLMYFFPNTASATTTAMSKISDEVLRSYFNKAGVLTVRPKKGTAFNMGATLKGGNNNEQHNHNDIGSFTIVVGNELLMGDPGLATYTSKTFSAERYSIKTLTSYGHPVPVLYNKLQVTGAKAKAEIISTSFSEKEDKMVMDITSAYDVPGLRKMIRTFIYHRSDKGFLEVNDEVEFSSAKTFETALITRADWKQVSSNTIELAIGKVKMLVTIIVPGNGFTIHAEVITEAPKPYTRLGIRLIDSVEKCKVSMIFKEVN